ncbi:MAG: PLP-dependent aminotransferase family protein [Sphaerochaetaceae bacterium]|nr:PLP-dependent aminotransferase family protein [Sphaerochaetaceae bacterium]
MALYLDIYNHFKNLIEEGVFSVGEPLPSIRQCCNTFKISKTTAQSAYFQLVANGYVISRNKSGFYVSEANRKRVIKEPVIDSKESSSCKYDFSIVGDDPGAFPYDKWQKYMKSTMRRKDELSTYGNRQGELDLRIELSNYVRKKRNIYCTPDSIIIGSSTQGLLRILLSLIKSSSLFKPIKDSVITASVPTESFSRYARVFEDYNMKVGFRNKEAQIIYVSPSHMTVWGEVMTQKRRHELLLHSRANHFIIEDDYQSEFNFSKEGCPSIYSLCGGEKVAYIGSFSRVLLPSIRISYMILPKELLKEYSEQGSFYDQGASKTEQLALCSFLRDNQLESHIRKIRRLYSSKREILKTIVESLCLRLNETFPKGHFKALLGDSGTEYGIGFNNENPDLVLAFLKSNNIKSILQPLGDNEFILLFSCGVMDIKVLEEIGKIWNKRLEC